MQLFCPLDVFFYYLFFTFAERFVVDLFTCIQAIQVIGGLLNLMVLNPLKLSIYSTLLYPQVLTAYYE